MMRANDNLLSTLHKWASRQDENFVTDAFAYLLRHLLSHDPQCGTVVLRVLTDGVFDIGADDARKVVVTTQVTTDHGRPDMKIEFPGHLAFVEVKVESRQGDRQLSRYSEALSVYARKGLATQLVYLTRYPEAVVAASGPSFHAVRWFQIANCLQHQLRTNSAHGSISHFLIEQFVGFLLERGMAMQKIQPDLSGGVRSLRNLLMMLGEVIAGRKLSCKRSSDFDFIGFDFDAGQFWIGVDLESPSSLVFETSEMNIDIEKAAGSGVGGVVMDHWTGKKKKWVNKFNVSSDNAEFFALSQSEQMNRIESFFNDCLEKAKQIEQPK